ncbi:G protein pathway suppressor 2 isoform X1 [Diorhabda sublineata]|uniref:G protein pathway suppressor 2 isoform X1 n=1 Tax=Diorhabda sublineata TaxID=1163346 RepID=UPI0024E15BC8|nr:G protein pathway suppressor 2 isoform X1 [Diorhabda sublineata]
MPTAVQDTGTKSTDHDEQMWKVLKAHILRERARKKQEREQEVEEERLRKEREAREQQDVMTLGETREQISQLEQKLTHLKEEKHQLFLQLKKVLNEDDNRRRQKENTENLISIQSLPTNMVHPQLYIQQPQQQQLQPTPQPRLAQMPQQPQPPPQAAYKQAKRPRSPSPPPQVSASMYHSYGYKPTTSTSTFQGSPQKDDDRRNELVRAVLWNKTPQYNSQPSAFYPVGPQDLPMYYSMREPSRTVYETPRLQNFHLEPKLPDHYTLRTPSSHGHVILPGALSITQQPAPKMGGSITAGYSVRSTPQYQQTPPTSLYSGQTRPLYQPTVNYPPRE